MPKLKAVRISRDVEFTAFCDTGIFHDGKCQIAPRDPNFHCKTHKKDICCIVCELLGKECVSFCERIKTT